MQVKRINGVGNWLRLPQLYVSWQRRDCNSRKDLEWKYLNPIAKEIVQSNDVSIGLLIGTNSMNVLYLVQVITSEKCGSYDYSTRLRWCIVGPIMNSDSKVQ